jgi:2-oxoglutarate dehydrogenase E2 component (dihydrolipoamide succinyltransferase)
MLRLAQQFTCKQDTPMTIPSNSDVTEVLLPSMGEGVAEATVVKWLKKAGESVNKDEPLLEVSTDKVDTEIPAPASGTLLKTTALEGATVEVNQTIGWIGPKGAQIPENPNANQDSASHRAVTTPTSAASVNRQKNPAQAGAPMPVSSFFSDASVVGRSSPLVRKMARDLGIDLRRVRGTGLSGRITKIDIEAWQQNPVAHQMEPSPVSEKPILARVETTLTNGQELLEGVPVRREKMTKMRRLIAEHMVDSVRVSPHVTTVFEIDLQKVVAVREKAKKTFAEREGFNLTFTPFLIRAAVEAIKKFPIVNVSVDGDEVLWKDQINIGCAVALGAEGGGGLIVPVIKKAQDKNLRDICKTLNDLATRARTKKLLPDEVIGGTFSVTNPGGWGSITSNPIINQPQVAMLGIGAIIKRAVVVDSDQIVIRPMMMASLTFDHRVIDGEGGAMWLAEYKRILENWSEEP